ncbi:MAG: 50S ribosomal protein L10 [Dehalococcoidales bacterium]|jgi:large subunit ribosomal protein L10|nr:50S ribosomal protein L10 [Dehalococcoidales bacterium]MDP6448729.1 50S ribosomal protein L10 [Dehalococcoidales bacterium]MDP6576400.1 50S ribosomal protein L10 [Dehalococcoidales bacterium]MDP6825453.1 50S ribosomal protein L10 [Dehalococcoidales bacterium]|tara:strand:+ start:278 stop:802 length:525 start_codon:yes stop_codon:yes gene_type:complete
MPKEKKVRIINELQEVFTESSVGILTDYRGLSTAEITELRHTLRDSEIKYRVVKNTLARFAAERAGKNELVNLLQGPVAIAFSYGDMTEPARILTEHIRTSKTSLSIKGGFLSDRALTSSDVETLATLPSKEILLGKVLGGMQSPVVTLISCLASPMRGVVGVLQARMKQLEEE